jgi:TonB family protein
MISKISIRNILITLLIHLILFLFLLFYKIDNENFSLKQVVTIEFSSRISPSAYFGIEEVKPLIIKSIMEKQMRKTIIPSTQVENNNVALNMADTVLSNSVDSLVRQEISSLEGFWLSDTGQGGAFGYGEGQFEEMPSFAGGGVEKFREWMIYNIRLSNIATQKKVSGTVLITFIVDIDGEVIDVNVQQGINAQIDNEAIRIIKSSPRWKPGRQRGHPVKVIYKIPLVFSM